MARDSTAVTAPQHSHGTASSLLDRVEAGLIAKMENGSSKKDRHRHGHGREEGKEAQSPSKGDSYGDQDGRVDNEVTHKKQKHHRHSSQAMSSQVSSQDVSGMSVDLDAPQRYFPAPEKKVELEKLKSQTPVGGQVVKREQAIHERDDENEDEEKVRRKEDKRRRKEERRAARQSLEAMKTQDLEGVSEEVVEEEKIVPETPRKEKRKLNTQVYDPESHPGSTSKAIPHLQVGGNCTENTPKHKKQRKHSQESPLHLHTVSAHNSPSTPGKTKFGGILNDTVGTSERKKKKKKEKEMKSKGLDSAKGALFKTVLKGCASSISNEDSTSGEVRKTPSIDEEYSSEDATEEAPRLESPSPIKPPKPRVNVPNSVSPIRPKKETGNEFKKETPILPPKRFVQSTKQSPVSIQNLARLKKEKAEPVTYSEDDDKDRRKSKKHEESASKVFKAIKTSNEGESKDVEDPFIQAMDSIRRSSSIMQNLFSPAPNTPSASMPNKKKEQSDSSVKVEGARNASTTTVLPLVFNEEGVKMVREDWEVALGKLRSSAGGGDDSEAQENIAFSSSYISSRSAGIRISNTAFQVHSLRHNEGWIVSTSSSPVEDSGKDFKLKICTLISGQVQVRLGKDGFGVGKGSVFRVRSGEDCVVRNREKKVAVVWVVCVE